jgi:hypothetical protein
MPRAGEAYRGQLLEAVVAEREQFSDPQQWQRSAKGNLWREWQGRTVTVFARRDGRWGWCISGEDGPQFSECGFRNMAAARESLAQIVVEVVI